MTAKACTKRAARRTLAPYLGILSLFTFVERRDTRPKSYPVMEHPVCHDDTRVF
jgi:hypothetical protein